VDSAGDPAAAGCSPPLQDGGDIVLSTATIELGDNVVSDFVDEVLLDEPTPSEFQTALATMAANSARWDPDNDGVPSAGLISGYADNCPNDPNADQLDWDCDGTGNECDNCTFAYNPDQANCNRFAELQNGAENLGNACDPHPCGETSVRISAKNVTIAGRGGGAGISQFRRRPESIQVEPILEGQGVRVDRTGFRFCPCSAASSRFDSVLQRFNCATSIGTPDLCTAQDSDLDIYDMPTTSPLPRWRPLTMTYSELSSRFASLPGGASILGAGSSGSEIADYLYTDAVTAGRLDPAQNDRGRFEVFWDAETDFGLWALPTPGRLDGIFWTHSYMTTGGGAAPGAAERKLQSHHLDGPFFELRAPEPFVAPFTDDCFQLFPFPGAPGPDDRPPAQPLGLPIDCLTFLKSGVLVLFNDDRLSYPWSGLFGGATPPPWVDYLDRWVSTTPWERERLFALGYGTGSMAHPASVVLKPDLSTVSGVLELQNGDLADAGFALVGVMPPSRQDFAAAMSGLDQTAWIGGGTTGGLPVIDLWRLDLPEGVWTEEPVLPPSATRVVALADSGPTRELLVLFEDVVGGAPVMKLGRLAHGGSDLETLAEWPLIHPGRDFAMAVGIDGDVFLAGADGAGWHAARLRRGSAHPMLEDGVASGTENADLGYFEANRFGMVTSHLDEQSGHQTRLLGVPLEEFTPGAASSVF